MKVAKQIGVVQQKEQKTAEQIRLDKLNAKASKIAQNFDENVKRNRASGDRMVYTYHNAWVVKPHSFTPSDESLSLD